MPKKFNRFVLPLFLAMVFLALPFFLEGTTWGFLVRILGVMGLYGILALGLNLVLGYVGLLDLGFMAFYAIGAYTTAVLSLRGWNFWFCLPASALMAMGVRTVLGAPVLRLRGDYLAVVTLGFGEITRITLNNWDSLTRGPQGISLLSAAVPPLRFFGYSLYTNTHFFYLIFAFLAMAWLVCRRLDRSRIGRAWIAIREDETAARSMGIHVARLKNVAFTISAGFAGVAGALFARWENFVTPESFTFWESALLVAMVVLGGMGSLPGVLLGVAMIVGLPEFLRADLFSRWGGGQMVNARYLIFGALLVGAALFRPEGVWPRSRRKD
ncbi:MAG: branched-chain amino acid ABC transporter permease [Elusimicrobia bacterium]|nr:branched-chain amino acid ABC transporter permease [Elusimicrobiota bacterium]